MSADSIWFPFYVGDYMADTMHLDRGEHGAYLLILFAYYKNQGPLPDDDRKMANTVKETVTVWLELRKTISPFFEIRDGYWFHKRAQAEIDRRKSVQIARQEAARRTNEGLGRKTVTVSVTDSKTGAKEGVTHSHSHNPQSQPESKSKEDMSRHVPKTSGHVPDNGHGKMELMTQARVVVHFLNEQSGRHFRETSENLSFINARLKESGVTLEGVKQMVARQCRLWKGTPQAEYLRPETLFNRTKFDSYYSAKDLDLPTSDKPKTGPTQSDRDLARLDRMIDRI